MISNSIPPISISVIDENRFGIRSARAMQVTSENLPSIIDFCNKNKIIFLTARCATDEFQAVHEMENLGFRLMDTLVYYGHDLTETSFPIDQGFARVRSFQEGEEEIIRHVAGKAFKGYRGHYHVDPHLPQTLCDETYADWAYQSCVSLLSQNTTNRLAEHVLVAEHEGEIKGFLTLRRPSQDDGEGVLFGVSPDAQGLGIGRSLMIGAMHWFKSQHSRRMIISTQIVNLSSQKVWAKLGFELVFAKYTFHKWFEER